ncbi:hypothetical protein PR048_001723 [Dryococelus australis]|uniref:Uncharacterized protein n=1 Tax=Dryococelus australis TaxID=614101 RepID=A0ABQ9IJI7_9NEOP|nr:hypothetical protein PR048_001723 [Dryococelus australis]
MRACTKNIRNTNPEHSSIDEAVFKPSLLDRQMFIAARVCHPITHIHSTSTSTSCFQLTFIQLPPATGAGVTRSADRRSQDSVRHRAGSTCQKLGRQHTGLIDYSTTETVLCFTCSTICFTICSTIEVLILCCDWSTHSSTIYSPCSNPSPTYPAPPSTSYFTTSYTRVIYTLGLIHCHYSPLPSPPPLIILLSSDIVNTLPTPPLYTPSQRDRLSSVPNLTDRTFLPHPNASLQRRLRFLLVGELFIQRTCTPVLLPSPPAQIISFPETKTLGRQTVLVSGKDMPWADGEGRMVGQYRLSVKFGTEDSLSRWEGVCGEGVERVLTISEERMMMRGGGVFDGLERAEQIVELCVDQPQHRISTIIVEHVEQIVVLSDLECITISAIDRVTDVEILRRMKKYKEVLTAVKTRKLQYLDHITRNESRYQLLQSILQGKIPGKRSAGRRRMDL